MAPNRLAEAVAETVAAAARNPRPVVAAALVLTLVLGAGATQFRFHNRFTEWVPDANEDKAAFDRAVEEIPGTVNYEVVWLELDPSKTDATNITSPEGIRGMGEFASYMRDRVPAISGVNGPLYWIKLANYANHANDPAYFRVPQDPASMEAAREAAVDANAEAIEHFTARDWSGALVAFPVGTEPLTPESNEAGAAIREAAADYRAEDDLEHDVFEDEYVVPVGVPSSSSASDAEAQKAVTTIAPWAALAVGLAVFLAFRRTRAVPLALVTVGVSTTWVLGVVGWAGQALNLFNLAIFPLILGNGIDYAIHTLHEARSGDGDGPGGIDAEGIADSVGVPILFVTATTVLGLTAMTLSSSTYLTELGLWASAAMIVTAFLSLTLLPALVALWPQALPEEAPRADWLASWARWGREHRTALVVVVLAVSGVAAWSASGGTYSVALMEESFPEDAPAVEAKERFEEKTTGGDVAFVIYEGNVTGSAARDYMDRVVGELADRGVVADTANVYDLPLVLQGYEAVESGQERAGTLAPEPPGGGSGGGDGDRGSSMSGDEARDAIESMYASPIWHSTAQTIVSPEQSTAVAYVNPIPRDDSFSSARDLDAAIGTAVQEAGPAPDDVSTHVYGFKIMAFDFLDFSITWLWVLFGLTFSATTVGAWFLLDDLRTVAAVTAPMAVSGLWWLGLLPVFGISITIYLFVAVLFITSIGSDYAAYLAWKARRKGSLEESFATTGRAVTYAAVTDGAAFLAFSFVAIPSASDMMLAAFLAIVTIFAATALTLPALMPDDMGLEAGSGEAEGAREVEAPAAGA
jgi:predicted RND superfamily exporter protein